MVSLKNRSGRMQIFVLAHESYCAARGECACSQPTARGARRVPRSLTLAAGATSPEVPDAVLAVPAVGQAVRRGELIVQRPIPVAPPAAPRVAVTPQRDPPSRVQPKKKRGSR